MPDRPIAFQDLYPDDVAHCYGCGRLNDQGHQIRSYWEGNETVARFTPGPQHTAIPGYVYGGLIASLIDCHGTGSAAAAAALHRGIRLGEDPLPEGELAARFVTASLEVKYLKPTPLGPKLVIRGVIEEVAQDRDPARGVRKVTTHITVEADGVVTAEGRVIAVRMPDSLVSS